MSQDALNRARRINMKLAEWQNTVADESTKNPLRVLELLAADPFITANGIAQKLHVAFTTAQRAIRRLEQLEIIQQAGDARRDRVYCAKALLQILEEPAQLTPERSTSEYDAFDGGDQRNSRLPHSSQGVLLRSPASAQLAAE